MESKDCSGCGYFSPDFYEHKLSLFWSGHFGKQNRYLYVLNMGTPGRHWKDTRKAGNHPASRRGFLRLFRVLPTSRVFTSSYVNTETI